jgi:hypothetical protein
MPNDECRELAILLDGLQTILKTTKDVAHRAVLERAIIYLGNRLADLSERKRS